jgi:hypothetical protein
VGTINQVTEVPTKTIVAIANTDLGKVEITIMAIGIIAMAAAVRPESPMLTAVADGEEKASAKSQVGEF